MASMQQKAGVAMTKYEFSPFSNDQEEVWYQLLHNMAHHNPFRARLAHTKSRELVEHAHPSTELIPEARHNEGEGYTPDQRAAIIRDALSASHVDPSLIASQAQAAEEFLGRCYSLEEDKDG